jgi:hypothetical protein
MNASLLSLEQTPPLSVPVRFFLTAPLFGILASLLLLYYGAELFDNRWNMHTLALTHLLTLGFITMVMFGAILQLLAVLAASPVPYPVLVSNVLHLSLTLGTLSLVAGFLNGYNWLMQSAVILLGFSLIGFISVVAYCLIRIKDSNPIFTAMSLALTALAVMAILGIGLGMLFGFNISLPFPQIMTDLHLTWGLIGWIVLLLIGVAYQVVPMFQITPAYPTRLTRWLVPLIFLSLLLWTAFYILALFNQVPVLVPQILMGLIGIGLSSFAVATLTIQKRRLRKLPDITLNYWRVGMLSLLLSVIFWLANIDSIFLIILFIGGFVLPVIQGMLYKILPFLVWLHLQNQQGNSPIKRIKVPNMKKIIPDKQARYQFWLYMLAFGLLIVAMFTPTYMNSVASIALMLSFLFLAYNIYSAVWLYWRVSREIDSL